jgi:hypothetical protein
LYKHWTKPGTNLIDHKNQRMTSWIGQEIIAEATSTKKTHTSGKIRVDMTIFTDS